MLSFWKVEEECGVELKSIKQKPFYDDHVVETFEKNSEIVRKIDENIKGEIRLENRHDENGNIEDGRRSDVLTAEEVERLGSRESYKHCRMITIGVMGIVILILITYVITKIAIV
ncbi:hypothetical protein SNEBB_003715 [Seison nebaliae]|nr:hypothetical protein SNEBB_003715 [Seison nebaliae]